MTQNDNIDLSNLDDLKQETWIKIAYIALLQRPVDEVGLQYWISKINDGTFNYKELIETIIRSPEYIMHYKIPFATILHQARQKWVSEELPPFNSILDIGGSSANTEMGALIELGYSHRPKSLIIFDLPPEKQYWGLPNIDQTKKYNFIWGEIEYIHGYAERINEYPQLNGKKFDCIFMGQTIEHIDPAYLPSLLNWIKRHLNTQGKLFFDTPNRIITKIQSPKSLIDSDHKYEYSPTELEELLKHNNFIVIKKWGLLHMPHTLLQNRFNPLEVYETESLNSDYDASYCFAFECIVINE